jgi:predicted nucleotidyltransferase
MTIDAQILDVVQEYLRAVNRAGIHAVRGVVFGSYARGEARADSDIDLVVVAADFDPVPDWDLVGLLWRQRAHADSRIEPIPCGVRQWEEDDSSAIIEVARREGVVVLYEPQAA